MKRKHHFLYMFAAGLVLVISIAELLSSQLNELDKNGNDQNIFNCKLKLKDINITNRWDWMSGYSWHFCFGCDLVLL